jgi:hypothetical protein
VGGSTRRDDIQTLTVGVEMPELHRQLVLIVSVRVVQLVELPVKIQQFCVPIVPLRQAA